MFDRGFGDFDPIHGDLPVHPFALLPEIARRARLLLNRRSAENIADASSAVDWMLTNFTEQSREEYIRELLDRPDPVWGLLPEEERNESGLRELIANWPPDATHQPWPDSILGQASDLEALHWSIGRYMLDDERNSPPLNEYEYFAVFALMKLADALHWLRNKAGSQGDASGQNRREGSPQSIADADVRITYSLAGECALQAMDAIGWAEHLQADSARKSEIEELRKQLHLSTETATAMIEARAREKISLKNSKAALTRHAENHKLKSYVFDWCDKHFNEYVSMDAAATAVAGKIVPVAFRTARNWISAWKRQVPSARKV